MTALSFIAGNPAGATSAAAVRVNKALDAFFLCLFVAAGALGASFLLPAAKS